MLPEDRANVLKLHMMNKIIFLTSAVDAQLLFLTAL